ncbi:MAG: hypothetical protein II874_04150 [Bacteroidales bacterium]|nr:hypothetical protein [Bacteroidales bacterium]
MAIDVENAELQPISGLPAATTFEGLYTIATDANNRSVKVPLHAIVRPPYIGQNGHWYIWSMSGNAYVDSGAESRGATGAAFTYQDFTEEQLAALKGADGSNGIGVSSSVVSYGLSDAQATAPASWSENIPTLEAGKWLWSRTVISYTNNTSSTIYTKIYLPTDGKSAYELAQEGGYQGTEEQFAAMLASLGSDEVWLTENEWEALTTKDPNKTYNIYEVVSQ